MHRYVLFFIFILCSLTQFPSPPTSFIASNAHFPWHATKVSTSSCTSPHQQQQQQLLLLLSSLPFTCVLLIFFCYSYYFIPEHTYDHSYLHSSKFFFAGHLFDPPECMYNYSYMQSAIFFCPVICLTYQMHVWIFVHAFIYFFNYFFQSAVQAFSSYSHKVHAFVNVFLVATLIYIWPPNAFMNNHICIWLNFFWYLVVFTSNWNNLCIYVSYYFKQSNTFWFKKLAK